MNNDNTLSQALLTLGAIEAKLSEQGQQYLAQHMRRDLSEYYAAYKALKDECEKDGYLGRELSKATKKYNDCCQFIEAYKLKLDAKKDNPRL